MIRRAFHVVGRLAIDLVAPVQRVPQAIAHLFGFILSDRAGQAQEAEPIELVSLLRSQHHRPFQTCSGRFSTALKTVAGTRTRSSRW